MAAGHSRVLQGYRDRPGRLRRRRTVGVQKPEDISRSHVRPGGLLLTAAGWRIEHARHTCRQSPRVVLAAPIRHDHLGNIIEARHCGQGAR